MRRTHTVRVGELLSHRNLTIRDLSALRGQLTDWATDEGLDADTIDAIKLSGYEALANSVEHGYCRQDGGMVELYADHTGNKVTITVVDHGHWQIPAENPVRGRGLVLIHGLSDNATVTTSDMGTTVTMTWRV